MLKKCLHHWLYSQSEYSFDFELPNLQWPQTRGFESGFVFTFDTLQLEVEWTGRLLYVWGYYSNVRWLPVKFPNIKSTSGYVKVIADENLEARIALAFPTWDKWQTYCDLDSGWVCISPYSPEELEPIQHIEFARNIVASISHFQLKALWLHPAYLNS